MIGCGAATTFVFGLSSVLLASILSGKTRKKYFWGYRKNLCARILNGFVRGINLYFSKFNQNFQHRFYSSPFFWPSPGLVWPVWHLFHCMAFSTSTSSYAVNVTVLLEVVSSIVSVWTYPNWLILHSDLFSFEWDQSTCTSTGAKTSTFQTSGHLSSSKYDHDKKRINKFQLCFDNQSIRLRDQSEKGISIIDIELEPVKYHSSMNNHAIPLYSPLFNWNIFRSLLSFSPCRPSRFPFRRLFFQA